MQKRVVALLVAAAFSAIVMDQGHSGAERTVILLPGTQPGHVSPADSFQRCTTCHEDIVRQWSGSMKAHAPRDPIFNALLAITTKKTLPLGLDVSEYCLRCHSPSGWLAGRSHELSTQSLFGTDLDGVHCDFCHRAVDPLHPPPNASISGTVPGYGNGMYTVMPSGEPRRGTRGATPAGHPTFYEPFLGSSEFCGVCHDVSNPYFDASPTTTPPDRQPPLERTYTEWKLSWYATQGRAGSCQSCHMPPEEGYASSYPGSRYRLDVAQHGFAGVNTVVPEMLQEFWPDVDTSALRIGRDRSMVMKAQAASLEVSAGISGESVVALVRVTNRTGHKLPTGFAEGRRMWIDVRGKDATGATVFRSGAYDSVAGSLVSDPQFKAYEARLGPSSFASNISGLPISPSFHVGLSDSVYFDNRIPPRGYRGEAFIEHRAMPVGHQYADGQYWDVTRFVMPPSVRSVDVSLMFQLVTKEFAEFLRDENTGNPYDWNQWGERLYSAWREKGTPVTMQRRSASVQPGEPRLAPVEEHELPTRVRLAQNYPNPFNASTTIEFWLSARTSVTLSVYDVAGREMKRMMDGELESGLHTTSLSSMDIASGMYFYRLNAGALSITRKLVVIK
ncbi:MAG: T9SS type A sorting domain-containing protein [Bacteroidota bacterium]